MIVNSTVIEEQDFIHGSKIVIQTLRGGSFRPNTLFLTIGEDARKDDNISKLVKIASDNELSILILRQHTRVAFGMQKDVNVWLRDKSPNWHLTILIALQLQINWEGKINLITVADSEESAKRLLKFLNRLSDQTRLPSLSEFHVLVGDFETALMEAPKADIQIMGVGENLPFEMMRNTSETLKSSCLFVKDSGNVSAIV